MTPEKFFETVPKRILGMNPDLEQIMLYMVCINEHLTKMLRFIPKTPQVCRVIERANRDTISLATTYWIPKYECNPLAEDGGFKTANEYRTAGERQEER
ncbi:hypothetical protein [Methanoculleus sp. UBA303]|uniref:hypothetical protein n=1 Tax=Methanoculleus sp. UBA303 TaxID=1915497 RepID=UPI0025FBB4F0|nr:hypothetical protein [Methanoculleus sp. UBA303]